MHGFHHGFGLFLFLMVFEIQDEVWHAGDIGSLEVTCFLIAHQKAEMKKNLKYAWKHWSRKNYTYAIVS